MQLQVPVCGNLWMTMGVARLPLLWGVWPLSTHARRVVVLLKGASRGGPAGSSCCSRHAAPPWCACLPFLPFCLLSARASALRFAGARPASSGRNLPLAYDDELSAVCFLGAFLVVHGLCAGRRGTVRAVVVVAVTLVCVRAGSVAAPVWTPCALRPGEVLVLAGGGVRARLAELFRGVGRGRW